MPATPEAQAKTRAFARVIGPFLVIVPCIVAVRTPDMARIVLLRQSVAGVDHGCPDAARRAFRHRATSILGQRGRDLSAGFWPLAAWRS